MTQRISHERRGRRFWTDEVALTAWQGATISAMTRGARDLLRESLDLLLDERAKMAAELLESLQAAESDWAIEIQRGSLLPGLTELASSDWRTVLSRVEREVFGR